jgi:hypothetical protein
MRGRRCGDLHEAFRTSNILDEPIVTIAFFLVADIDSPRSGVIRVAPQNLIALSGSLRAD